MTLRNIMFAAGLALAGVAGGAHATPITYTFSGVTFGGDDPGQTLTGTYTFDPANYDAHYTNGTTIGQAYTAHPDPTASAHVQLSGGFRMDVGDLATGTGGATVQSIVFKGVPDPTPANRFEVYASSTDAAGNWANLELMTENWDTTPSAMFPDAPATDLDPTQPAVFFTPGSENVGYIALFAADGSRVITDFTITQLNAVPEAPVPAMLAAGALMLGLRRRKNAR